ncbi:DUF5130 family protein [Nocardioides bruguierae]|uniref:DUF5130 domain-containing protein n=1 Tax=Nocardioides bruguierae TaxID=2945102 RepID=A0A9X2D7U8_9ACTN|nr:DUF5130 family protein [Nocardioides bruguierae]MCM0620402.1 DUF5130 domain-containing protein [Nocardioides bruguierae]
MPAGDISFSSSKRADLEGAIRAAETLSRVEFSVFVGDTPEDTAAYARRLHGGLAAPARSVLIMIDGNRRALEIVAGSYVRRTLTDAELEIATIQLSTDLAAGDVHGGLKRCIGLLAEHARPQRVLHADEEPVEA